MKKILTPIAVAVFLIYPCVVSAYYVIHLKDGREFVTDRYYEEGEQIKFKRYVTNSCFKEKRRWLVSEKSWVCPFTLAKEEYGLATSFR